MAFGKNVNTRTLQPETPTATQPMNWWDDLASRNKNSIVGQALGWNNQGSLGNSGVQDPGSLPYKEELGPIQQEIFDADWFDLYQQHGADIKNQWRALAFGEEVKAGFDAVDKRFADLIPGITGRREQLQAQIDEMRTRANAAPENIQAEFGRLRNLLTTTISSAVTGLESDRADALSRVFNGHAQAMGAATQGIQGNLRASEAQIDSLVAQGQISQAQAQQMKSQVRVGSSMQLGTVVGQTQLAFNKLEADTAASFTSIIGQVKTSGVQVLGAFDQASGNAFASTTQQTNEIFAKMAELQKTADSDMNSLFVDIETQRMLAENMGDVIGQALLPLQDEPYMQISNIFRNKLDISKDILELDMSEQHFQAGQDLLAESLRTGDFQGGLNWATSLLQWILEGIK